LADSSAESKRDFEFLALSVVDLLISVIFIFSVSTSVVGGRVGGPVGDELTWLIAPFAVAAQADAGEDACDGWAIEGGGGGGCTCVCA